MGKESPSERAGAETLTVDARGLSCPEPVIMTMDAIKAAAGRERIEVLVDTATSRNNVLLAARQRGWDADFTEDGDGTFHVMLKK